MFLLRHKPIVAKELLKILPADVWHLICKHCSINTLITLRLVAKFFPQHYTKAKILELVATRTDLIFTQVSLNDLYEAMVKVMLMQTLHSESSNCEKYKNKFFDCKQLVFKTKTYDIIVPGLETISFGQISEIGAEIATKLGQKPIITSAYTYVDEILTLRFTW